MVKHKKSKQEDKKILNFFAEAGALKQIKRSGWWLIGAKDAESVAEHSFRCSIVGYVLAKMEKVAPYRVVMMTLLNDFHEARLTDLHKLAQRYINLGQAEIKAFNEQMKPLPPFLRQELAGLHSELRGQKTKAAILARDADILECLVQAKEYHEQGFVQAAKLMEKAPKHLKSRSARKLWEIAKNTELNKWWFVLSEFKR